MYYSSVEIGTLEIRTLHKERIQRLFVASTSFEFNSKAFKLCSIV